MGKIRWWKIWILIVLLVIGSGLTLCFDTWTVPAQNKVAISQLNGGGAEFAMMQTTNSTLTTIRSWIMPLFFLAIIIVALQEVFRVRKEIKKEETTK